MNTRNLAQSAATVMSAVFLFTLIAKDALSYPVISAYGYYASRANNCNPEYGQQLGIVFESDDPHLEVVKAVFDLNRSQNASVSSDGSLVDPKLLSAVQSPDDVLTLTFSGFTADKIAQDLRIFGPDSINEVRVQVCLSTLISTGQA